MRYIEFVDDDAFFSNWVSYATSKPFAEYHGLFSGTLLPAGNGPASFVTADNVTDVCNMLVSTKSTLAI